MIYKRANITVEVNIEDIKLLYKDSDEFTEEEKLDRQQIINIIKHALIPVSEKLDFVIESIEIPSEDFQ